MRVGDIKIMAAKQRITMLILMGVDIHADQYTKLFFPIHVTLGYLAALGNTVQALLCPLVPPHATALARLSAA